MTLKDMTLSEYLHGVNGKSATNSFPVNPMYSVDKRSVKVMHDCICIIRERSETAFAQRGRGVNKGQYCANYLGLKFTSRGGEGVKNLENMQT